MIIFLPLLLHVWGCAQGCCCWAANICPSNVSEMPECQLVPPGTVCAILQVVGSAVACYFPSWQMSEIIYIRQPFLIYSAYTATRSKLENALLFLQCRGGRN